MNSDASVKRLKGESRPITNENDRAILLSALETVDAVVIMNEDTPLKMIQAIVPDVLVKGADYKADEVVGADVVKDAGGEVVLVPLVQGKSTSSVIKSIKID